MISGCNNPPDEYDLGQNTTQTPAAKDVSLFKIRVPIAIKLALAITILIVSGMSTLGFIILENQKSVLNQQINDMGSAIARQVASSASEMVLSDDNLGLQTLVNNLVDNQQIKGAVVISDQNKILVKDGKTPSIDFIQYQLRNKNSSHIFEWNSDKDSANKLICFDSPIKFKQLVAGHIIITFSKQQMVQSLENSRFVIIFATLLMSMIAILLAFVMSRHLSRPIHNLVDASKAIGAGDFKYRLNERRNDEIGELACAFNQMAHGLLQKSQVEDVFSRYVSSNVAEKVLQNLEDVELGGKHVNASVLFADIVGFTSISEKLPPDEIANLLNEYFTHISTIAQLHNGHIDKFMGDCAMVVFGVPDHTNHHSIDAISCAIMIQEMVARLNEKRLKRQHIPIHFKIGINSGDMIAGNLGSSDRMEYTVIGDPVNIASRLAGIAEGGQIIILEQLYNNKSVYKQVIANQHKVIRVRGKQKPVSTWLVESALPEKQCLMKNTVVDILSDDKEV
jgi:adenylate cyclase